MKIKRLAIFLVLLSIFFLSVHYCYGSGIQDAISNANAAVKDTTVKTSNVAVLIGTILKIIIGMAGVLFLGMILWSGINWMLSAGDQAKITKSKTILIYSTMGLIVVITAYSIVLFTLSAFGINQGNGSGADGDSTDFDSSLQE